MKNTVNKYWKQIVFCFAILIIGFLAGRCSDKTIEKIEYIKGDTIRDTIYKEQLIPYEVRIPANPILPMKPDTIVIPSEKEIRYIIQKVDTAAIISNYIAENKYRRVLFDNKEQGSLIIGATVQYNQLSQLDYEYEPIYKVIAKERKRTFTPFIQGSYNSFNYLGIGGGIFYHDIGISAKYLTNFTNTGYEVGLLYKF